MTTSTITTPRPSASQISFADECFECAGYVVEYSVTLPAPNYPKRFSTYSEADVYARLTQRAVTETRRPIWRRIRWN